MYSLSCLKSFLPILIARLPQTKPRTLPVDFFQQSCDGFPLAVLVAQIEQRLVTNYIPLLFQGKKKLIGHLALNNNPHRLFPSGEEVPAIFRGEDTYISLNWYSTKPVRTWNYQVAHVYGTVCYQVDNKSKLAVFGRLTKQLEEQTNGESLADHRCPQGLSEHHAEK
jgi:predicted FMN-binding regulatory protein PaiB